MKRVFVVASVIVLAFLALAAHADVATWDVATVHGYNQFTISQDGTSLLYDEQPRNTNGWYWYENNKAAPGVLATGGKQTPDGYRDGSRTFATTDVAVGQSLDSTKLVFEYKHSLGGYVTINYFLTDGNGHYGIFAPTSLGITVVGGIQQLDANWSRMTVDLTSTSIPDSTTVAIYEHNGFCDEYGNPYTTMTWGDIKDLQIAGMYNYQRSPALGWDSWGSMFSQINAAGSSTIVNGYGMALIWGDTVGSDTYTQQQREIRNVVVTSGGTEYTGTFMNSQVPEPSAIMVLVGGLGSLLALRRRMA